MKCYGDCSSSPEAGSIPGTLKLGWSSMTDGVCLMRILPRSTQLDQSMHSRHTLSSSISGWLKGLFHLPTTAWVHCRWTGHLLGTGVWRYLADRPQVVGRLLCFLVLENSHPWCWPGPHWWLAWACCSFCCVSQHIWVRVHQYMPQIYLWTSWIFLPFLWMVIVVELSTWPWEPLFIVFKGRISLSDAPLDWPLHHGSHFTVEDLFTKQTYGLIGWRLLCPVDEFLYPFSFHDAVLSLLDCFRGSSLYGVDPVLGCLDSLHFQTWNSPWVPKLLYRVMKNPTPNFSVLQKWYFFQKWYQNTFPMVCEEYHSTFENRNWKFMLQVTKWVSWYYKTTKNKMPQIK